MKTLFNQDYYENGIEKGLSCYKSYRWLPELTIPMCFEMISKLGIEEYETILDFGCFIRDTKIKMSNLEEKNIQDIKIGDELISHNNNKCKVVNIFNRKADTIKMNLRFGIDITTTKEHPFLCLKKEHIICKCGGTCNSNNKYSCSKCNIENKFISSFIKVEDLKVGDFLAFNKNNSSSSEINSDLAGFLGFYLAEGSVMYSHKPHIGGINLCFNINETEYIEQCEKMALKCGATSVTKLYRKEKNTCDVQCFGKQFAELIYKLGGKGCSGKKIHSSVFDWSDKDILLLIQNWYKGDGYSFKMNKKGYTHYICSVSKELVKDFQFLLTRFNIMAGIYKVKPKINRKQAYILAINDCDLQLYKNQDAVLDKNATSKKTYRYDSKYIYVPIVSINSTNNKEEVFNIEVEKDHTYIANGLSVHNCSKGFLVKAMRMLYREAYGVDISEYAIDASDKDIKPFLQLINPGDKLPLINNRKYDWLIAKDVLEHVPYDHLEATLKNIRAACKFAFIVVPLGNNGKYVIPEYELDITHQIREDLNWWKDLFEKVNFKVTCSDYKFGHIKKNWANWDKGNGFFVLK